MPRKRTNNLILSFLLLVFNLNLSQITLYYVQSCLCMLRLPFSLSHLDDEGNLGALCRSDCLVHPIACLQLFPSLQEHGQNTECQSSQRQHQACRIATQCKCRHSLWFAASVQYKSCARTRAWEAAIWMPLQKCFAKEPCWKEGSFWLGFQNTLRNTFKMFFHF